MEERGRKRGRKKGRTREREGKRGGKRVEERERKIKEEEKVFPKRVNSIFKKSAKTVPFLVVGIGSIRTLLLWLMPAEPLPATLREERQRYGMEER